MARNSRIAKTHPFGSQRGIINRVTSSITRMQAQSAAFRQEIIAPFVDNTRNQQLADITVREELGEVQVQKKAKRNLYISSASLLFISAGALFYTPLYVPGTLGLLYIYSSFFKGAYHAIVKEQRINVDVLNVVFATGAIMGGFSFVMALGLWYGSIMRWLLAKTENNSRKSLVNLFGEVPRFVWVVVDGTEVEVAFEDVQAGDEIIIVAGQMIPVDGTISAGMASINQQMLTGEGQPAEKGVGEPVFARQAGPEHP